MALYTFPETTSGFLVLCLPVFPKFFNSVLPKRYLEVMKNLKVKAFSQSGTPAQANVVEGNQSDSKGRPRSWWHITDMEASQVAVETDGDTIVKNNSIESESRA